MGLIVTKAKFISSFPNQACFSMNFKFTFGYIATCLPYLKKKFHFLVAYN